MKRTKIISGLLAAVWSVTILGIGVTGFFSKSLVTKELLDECNGDPFLTIDDNNLDYSIEELSDRESFTQMENYYYNLRGNFGYNQTNSCGYVALGMLLTYYDSYWNDDLVPEQYDANAYLSDLNAYSYSVSPGSNETVISNVSNLTKEEYTELLISNSYSSLHAKLVSIGSSLGYGLGTTPDTVKNVLEKYLDDNPQISGEDWTINKYSNENYKSKVPGQDITYSEMMLGNIKDYLKLDIPVLVSVRSDSDGHVVIAYDYDEENDIVYAHYGWYGGYSHVNIFSSGNKYVRGYITMGPRRSHSHSNNYIVGGVAMCSCALPNHKHVFTYKSNNAVTHTKSCFCGYSATENHRFKRGTGINSKYLICQSCTYMKLDDGTITPVLPNL